MPDAYTTRGWTLAQKIEFYSAKPNAKGCRFWTGSLTDSGYAQLHWKGRPRKVHRLVLEQILGRPIKESMAALHTCDQPACVEPSHLWEGTQFENVKDMIVKGRNSLERPKGTDHGMARLTEKQVYAIRASKKTLVTIANKYGISHQHAQAIRSRKIWKHLPKKADEAPPSLYSRKHTTPALRKKVAKAKGSNAKVGKRFGISEATVSRIRGYRDEHD